MIIGISGRAQHGKDTVASIFNNYTSMPVRSFAEGVKKIASELTGIPINFFEIGAIKNNHLPEEWNINGEPTTVRKFLQKIGTDMRESIHENIWINYLFLKYSGDIIISDVRFYNEIEAIKKRGGIIVKVFRPNVLKVFFKDNNNSDEEDHSGIYYVREVTEHKGKVYYGLTDKEDGENVVVRASIKQLTFKEEDQHPSEMTLDGYFGDYLIINDKDINSLTNQVKNILSNIFKNK